MLHGLVYNDHTSIIGAASRPLSEVKHAPPTVYGGVPRWTSQCYLLFVFVFLPLCLGATPMQGIELATVVLGNAMAARVMMIGTITIQLPQ